MREYQEDIKHIILLFLNVMMPNEINAIWFHVIVVR